MNGTSTLKQFASFRLDRSNECLWQHATQVPLPPKTFAVLGYLVDHPARLVTHDELLDALWPETYVQPQVLRTYILELRKVLGDDAGQPRFIQTLPKRGYRFIAPVADVSSADQFATAAPSAATSTVESAQECSALGPAADAGLVGRDRELTMLEDEMGSLSQARRRMVFITGEAGIGKSALVEAFMQQQAASPTVQIARGQCVEGFGAKEEYYPVTEALAQLCRPPSGRRACAVLQAMAPAWLARSKHDSDASADRPAARSLDRMPGDLCAALEEIAADQPLVLIFEDVNWADAGTLQLLSALARRRAAARLLVVATFRPQTVAPDHPLRALKQDLQMRRLSEEIALQPLAKDHVRALLAKQLQQQALPPGLTSFVHQYSEGNPLFAIALLEHLLAERCLVCEATDGSRVWKQRTPFEEMEDRVPSGLAQMIELEVDCLAPEEQRLLEASSLVGIAFPAWAVAAALQMEEAAVEDACDALARKLYFLDRAGQDELPDGVRSAFYVFAHGLYRDVLYRRQSESRRARWHARIAERLGELFHSDGPSIAREMAFHYEAATDWQRAITALRSAAHQAQERHAYAEAIDLLEHIARLAGNLPANEQKAMEQANHVELQTIRAALNAGSVLGTLQTA